MSENKLTKKARLQISVSESGRDLPSKTQHQGQKLVSEPLCIVVEKEAKNNLFGFFDLAFRVAIRETQIDDFLECNTSKARINPKYKKVDE